LIGVKVEGMSIWKVVGVEKVRVWGKYKVNGSGVRVYDLFEVVQEKSRSRYFTEFYRNDATRE
jgi:hypothetical protein